MPRIEEMVFWSILDERDDDDVLSEEEQCILFFLLDEIFDDTDELMLSSDESSDGWSSSLSLSDSSEEFPWGEEEVRSYFCPSRRLKHDSKASEEKGKKRQSNEEKLKSIEVASKDDQRAAKKSKLSRAQEEIKTQNSKCDVEVGVKPRAPVKSGKEMKKRKEDADGIGCAKHASAREALVRSQLQSLPKWVASAREDLVRRRVQALPKLPIPKKASAIKGKEKIDGDQT